MQNSTVINHLPHFEELYHHPDIKIFDYNRMRDILKGIMQYGGFYPNDYSIKIVQKIDGSPSVIFGVVDGDVIVATKALFNKHPIIYTSFDLIDRIADANLRHKMRWLYARITNNIDAFPDRVLFHGDFLEQTEKYHYSSNISTYKVQSINSNLVFVHSVYEIREMENLYFLRPENLIRPDKKHHPDVAWMIESPVVHSSIIKEKPLIFNAAGRYVTEKSMKDLSIDQIRKIIVARECQFFTNLKLRQKIPVDMKFFDWISSNSSVKFTQDHWNVASEILSEIAFLNGSGLFGEGDSLKKECINFFDSGKGNFQLPFPGFDLEGYVVYSSILPPFKIVDRCDFSHKNFIRNEMRMRK